MCCGRTSNRIFPRMKRLIGIDLGGTNLRAGLVDAETGEVSALQSVPTLAREGPAAVMERMAGWIRSVAEAGGGLATIGAVGIGVPGVLDIEKGVVLFLPNLP